MRRSKIHSLLYYIVALTVTIVLVGTARVQFNGLYRSRAPMTVENIPAVQQRPSPKSFSCEGVSTVVVVKSEASHLALREKIRSSWFMKNDVLVLFYVSLPPSNPSLDKAINEERELRGDIIMFQTDSLPFSWLLEKCPKADFLLKTEDDVFLNIERLDAFLELYVDSQRSIFANFKDKHILPLLHSRLYRTCENRSPNRISKLFDGGTFLVTFDLLSTLQSVSNKEVCNYTASVSSKSKNVIDATFFLLQKETVKFSIQDTIEFQNDVSLPNSCFKWMWVVSPEVRCQNQVGMWENVLEKIKPELQ